MIWRTGQIEDKYVLMSLAILVIISIWHAVVTLFPNAPPPTPPTEASARSTPTTTSTDVRSPASPSSTSPIATRSASASGHKFPVARASSAFSASTPSTLTAFGSQTHTVGLSTPATQTFSGRRRGRLTRAASIGNWDTPNLDERLLSRSDLSALNEARPLSERGAIVKQQRPADRHTFVRQIVLRDADMGNSDVSPNAGSTTTSTKSEEKPRLQERLGTMPVLPAQVWDLPDFPTEMQGKQATRRRDKHKLDLKGLF
ncbi:unnamed protein product [Protopolystoma xenopodis]|uniref:Uncharacterized protein n=1 Tax=Protopolystoma xenopodis TaxID=117903 RepID=A0A448WM67_9PLAT|nr:unnamed protein product [Protopolystoma xenopodis]